MRTSRLPLLVAASLLAVPLTARAQQYATVTTCTILADAGAVGDAGTVACPVIASNFQPMFATCQWSTPAHESNNGIVVMEGCTTATSCAPIADGGFNLPFQGGGAAAATYSVSSSTSDKNPWPYMQPVAVGTTGEISDGGAAAAGYGVCSFGVLQSQTIHSKKPVIRREN